MFNKYGVQALLILSGCLLCIGLPDSAQSQYIAQDSSANDFNQEWLRRLFATEILSLSRQGDAVHFETTGRLAKYDARRYAWADSFTLKPGEQFHLQDRHGRVRFTVKEFDDQNVVIEASALMNHEEGTDKSTLLVVPYRKFSFAQ